MALNVIQNFYKETITRAVSLVGATNIYVSVHPTPAQGYITISPASTLLREIVFYTAKGTDGNGTYITVTLANRGLGGTTAQTHAIGETVRMNVTAETIQEISDAIDQIVAAGAQTATEAIAGIAKLPRIISAQAATLAITTVANEKVIVWAKGNVTLGNGESGTITLNYDGNVKDTVVGSQGDAEGYTDTYPFSLIYTETPGAATANITVSSAGGTLANIVIIAVTI